MAGRRMVSATVAKQLRDRGHNIVAVQKSALGHLHDGMSMMDDMGSPRDTETRIVDTLELLKTEVDAWVATAGISGPWVVPLSFAWDGNQLVFATSENSRTVHNLEQDPRVRVCLGTPRDVVIIDGSAELASVETLTDKEITDFGTSDTDPRSWATAVVRLTPGRIQAWREENEIAGRTIMQDGQWETSG